MLTLRGALKAAVYREHQVVHPGIVVPIDSTVRHVLDADANIDEPTQPDVKPDMTGELSSGPELFVAEGWSIHDRRGAACDKTQQSVLVLEHQVGAHRSDESGFTPPGQEPPRHFELGMEFPSGTQIGFPGQTVDPIDFHLVETIAGPVGGEARPQTHGIEKVITRQDDACAYQQTTQRYERRSPHILPFHRSQFRDTIPADCAPSLRAPIQQQKERSVQADKMPRHGPAACSSDPFRPSSRPREIGKTLRFLRESVTLAAGLASFKPP
jgi:hypothetical protein